MLSVSRHSLLFNRCFRFFFNFFLRYNFLCDAFIAQKYKIQLLFLFHFFHVRSFIDYWVSVYYVLCMSVLLSSLSTSLTFVFFSTGWQFFFSHFANAPNSIFTFICTMFVYFYRNPFFMHFVYFLFILSIYSLTYGFFFHFALFSALAKSCI